MVDDLIHTGTKSWWDGSVKTLCGLKLPAADRIVFPSLSSRKECLGCAAASRK